MLPELLKAGYLGLITALVYLSYRAIINLNKSNRPTTHIIIIISLFFCMNLIAGIAGYRWASKELEATMVRKNTALILNAQIDKFSNEHKESILPIQNALNDIASKLNHSVFEDYREQHIKEMERMNKMLQDRETAFSEKINSLKKNFPETLDR